MQRGDVEPESREDLAPDDSTLIGLERDVATIPERKPGERDIEDAPNQVFSRAFALVHSQFVVQIVRGAACRDFDHDLGWPLDMSAFIDPGGPTQMLLQTHQHIGLRLIVAAQLYGYIRSRADAGSGSRVVTEPGAKHNVLYAMTVEAQGGRHVDDSLDELRLLQVGHRLVAPLELLSGEAVAILQREDAIRRQGMRIQLNEGWCCPSGHSAHRRMKSALAWCCNLSSVVAQLRLPNHAESATACRPIIDPPGGRC